MVSDLQFKRWLLQAGRMMNWSKFSALLFALAVCVNAHSTKYKVRGAFESTSVLNCLCKQVDPKVCWKGELPRIYSWHAHVLFHRDKQMVQDAQVHSICRKECSHALLFAAGSDDSVLQAIQRPCLRLGRAFVRCADSSQQVREVLRIAVDQLAVCVLQRLRV